MDNILTDVSINSFEANLTADDYIREGGGESGHSPYIGENGNWYEYNDATGQYIDTGVKAEGPKGDDGRGITSVTKTSTSGLVDTYTITYTDNTTSTYTVTNGQNGTNGSDYVLTAQDKSDIANLVLADLPTWTGGNY